MGAQLSLNSSYSLFRKLCPEGEHGGHQGLELPHPVLKGPILLFRRRGPLQVITRTLKAGKIPAPLWEKFTNIKTTVIICKAQFRALNWLVIYNPRGNSQKLV